MADKLRPEDLQAFKGAFDMFDKNQDGTISTKVSKIFWALSKLITQDLISSVVEFQRWWVLKSKIFAMWFQGFHLIF